MIYINIVMDDGRLDAVEVHGLELKAVRVFVSYIGKQDMEDGDLLVEEQAIVLTDEQLHNIFEQLPDGE